MNAAELAAYVGALAWLPQVGSWIYKAAVKPDMEIVFGIPPEIGYTTFGPILNLSCAISVKRVDAVVRKIEMQIEHEKGQISQLNWATLNETFSEITSLTGEKAEIAKRQSAIALKVPTISLAEKVIGFQDPEFTSETRRLENKTIDASDHIKRTHPADFRQKTFEAREFGELCEFYKKNFCWQQGKYKGLLRVYLTASNTPSLHNFEFCLEAYQIERLKQNLDQIKQVLSDWIQPPPPEQKRTNTWNWIYPELTQKLRGRN